MCHIFIIFALAAAGILTVTAVKYINRIRQRRHDERIARTKKIEREYQRRLVDKYYKK